MDTSDNCRMLSTKYVESNQNLKNHIDRWKKRHAKDNHIWTEHLPKLRSV